MEGAYLQLIQDTLPAELQTQVGALPRDTRTLVDTLLRFSCGGDCPAHASDATRREWPAQQLTTTQALKLLHTQSNGKRTRDSSDVDDHTAKKSRTSPSPAPASSSPASDEEDRPLYTLHALSVAAPLRKKLDIQIHERSLRLINPGTQAVEASVPTAALKRAFLLPTRGKTKPHWTVLLLSSDTPAPTAKAAGAKDAAKDAAKDNVQIAFGVDAAPPAFRTTDHGAASAPAAHPKGTPVLPFLRAFLAHLPVPALEPDVSVFRSAAAAADAHGPAAGVQAYRAAREGTLWLLGAGILWDSRPAEFWGAADLVGGADAGGEAGTGTDGVRLVSATGRTCSVFVRRRVGEGQGKKEEGAGAGDAEGEEDEIRCVETDFSMVDGREQDGITQWVKRHRHLFGRPAPAPAASPPRTQTADVKGKGRAVAPPLPPDEDDEDADDSDFVDDSGSDGASATSEDGSGSGEEDGSGDDAEDEDEDEDEGEGDEEELDPARHPLLRPGAVPRMSKAAMDAAVGMVLDDFVGGSGSRGDAKGKGRVRDVESEEEGEEDELED